MARLSLVKSRCDCACVIRRDGRDIKRGGAGLYKRLKGYCRGGAVCGTGGGAGGAAGGGAGGG